MCAYRVLVAVAMGPELIQLPIDHFMPVGMATQEGRVRLADRLAVPARALRVRGGKHLLVSLAGPFKGRRELGFINFIIMVDKDARLVKRVIIVKRRGELVCMP